MYKKGNNMIKKLQIAIIGSAGSEEYPSGQGIKDEQLKSAEKIGQLLAQKNCIVVTGGKGGIMEAAARGAKLSNGITVGVISGNKRFTSNKFTDIEVLTASNSQGLDEFIIVSMVDALIVLGGGAGTLQEITIAYRNSKPIISMENSGGWAEKLAGKYLDERKKIKIQSVLTEQEAVIQAIKLAQQSLHTSPL